MSCSITSEKILALRSSQTSCFPDVLFHTQASVQMKRDGPGLTHLLSHWQWQAAALHQYGRSGSDSAASHWRNYSCARSGPAHLIFPKARLAGLLVASCTRSVSIGSNGSNGISITGNGRRELRHPTYVADSRMQPSLWQCTADSFSDLRDRDFTAPQVEQSAPTPNFFYHLSRAFGGGLENTCGQSSCQCYL